MSYMENQMDNLINSSEAWYDAQCDELDKDIENFIKEQGYTWSVKSIIDCYRKQRDGYYISHTAKIVVDKFKDRLDKLTK